MEEPPRKIIATKTINLNGVELEVRLIEVFVWNYNDKNYRGRILPKVRYIKDSQWANQDKIRNKLKEFVKGGLDE